MEGAVRSGYKAAEAVTQFFGTREQSFLRSGHRLSNWLHRHARFLPTPSTCLAYLKLRSRS